MTITDNNAPRPERPSVDLCPGRPRRTSPDNLVGRLNLEWARLSVAAESMGSVAAWGAMSPALRGAGSLEGVLTRIWQADVKARDEALLALLELSRDGIARWPRTSSVVCWTASVSALWTRKALQKQASSAGGRSRSQAWLSGTIRGASQRGTITG
jgi:hypothetical protein